MRKTRIFSLLLPLLILAVSSCAFATPTITVSPTSITASSGNCTNYPPNQQVVIGNSGSGTLAAPTVSATYGSGATNWLNMWVTGSSAPYTLNLQFQGLCGLSNGTYTATVYVSSSGASNSPVSLPVTLTIGSGSSPTISLSPTSITASSGNCTNYPPNQQVTISNSGSGTLAAPTVSATYGSGATDWLNMWVTGSSAPYTLNLQFQGLCGLSNGTYTATVNVSSTGASNSPVSLPVTLTIGSGSSPTISLSSTSLSFVATAGGSNPASQNVTVGNSGGGTLAAPTTSITYGSGSGWLSTAVQGSSAPFTIVNQPSISGLAAGTYTATVNVSSSGASNSPQSYTVTLTLSSGGQCVDSSLNQSSCGPYLYTPDTESNGSNTLVGQDVFNASSGMTQAIYVTTPGNWYATAQIPYDSGDAVKSYPNTQQFYNGEKLDNYTALYSAFTESADQSTNTSTDIGYDIFFNGGYNNEVMIQNDLVNRGGQCGPVLATQTFGGTNGVPVNTWVLCVYGSETIWQIQQPSSGQQTFGFQSGSVDLLHMLQWLEDNTNPNTGKTYIPAGSTMYSISYGFELCYTNNVQENFTVTNFSITNN